MGKSDVKMEDMEIIGLLVQKEMIDKDQAEECLKIQSQYKEKGYAIRLEEILVQKGYLSLGQARVIASQKPTKNLMETPSSSQASNSFGRYQILSELGRGGMGVVYKAYDSELKRYVALKIIQNQALVGEKQKKRFAREAQLMAKLNHPNLIRIFDVGQEQGHCFFTMELLEGSL